AELLRLHADRVDVARRERKSIVAAFHGVDPQVLVEVPQMASDVSALEDLAVIGAHLYGGKGARKLRRVARWCHPARTPCPHREGRP
ncbi:MAG: hypothetical protein ACRDU8_01895, partial [Egibacteraceae bacterium]